MPGPKIGPKIGTMILPSNEERGYVARMLIRRAFRFGKELTIELPFLYKLVPSVTRVMRRQYPELETMREGIADIVNIYVLKAGGIYHAKKALHVSEAVGLDAFVGSFNELSISIAAGAHLSATITNLPYPCYLVGPTLHEEDILADPLDIREGMFHLTDRPGLGIQVDGKQLKKFSV